MLGGSVHAGRVLGLQGGLVGSVSACRGEPPMAAGPLQPQLWGPHLLLEAWLLQLWLGLYRGKPSLDQLRPLDLPISLLLLLLLLLL